MSTMLETARITARARHRSDDELAVAYTAFESMDALLNANGGYFPSLNTSACDSIGRLADAYDAYQHARNDPRRAHRY